jgi:hypothetical protein
MSHLLTIRFLSSPAIGIILPDILEGYSLLDVEVCEFTLRVTLLKRGWLGTTCARRARIRGMREGALSGAPRRSGVSYIGWGLKSDSGAIVNPSREMKTGYIYHSWWAWGCSGRRNFQLWQGIFLISTSSCWGDYVELVMNTSSPILVIFLRLIPWKMGIRIH